MNELDEVKVWLFYLKNSDTNDLYAFTATKEFKKRFLEERNSNKFYIEKITMNSLDFSVFAMKYKSKKLNEYPINLDQLNHAVMLLTEDEEISLDQEAYRIDNEIEIVYSEIRQNPITKNLSDKYIESLLNLSDIKYLKKRNDGTIDSISRINLLLIFSKLFKNTL